MLIGIGIAADQVHRAHHHAGRTKAALKGVVFVKGLLHGMQRAVGGETFDGPNFGSIRLHGEHGARLHTVAVNVHHTRPALAGIAPDVRACEPQTFPQELNEKEAWLDLGICPFTVMVTAAIMLLLPRVVLRVCCRCVIRRSPTRRSAP
jgi:hypothetical protein